MAVRSITALDLQSKKTTREKLVMVTAYDATFASLLDESGVDALLVGDSLGMVIQGHQNTLPVTLEHIIYHTAAVARGARRAHIVADMPFMSYQVSRERALESAGRLLKEGSAHSVKLEGGEQYAEHIRAMVRAGIPVMGHIGLTPQSVHQLGGFKVQGKDAASAERLLEDARALESAGAYAIVLEAIPAPLAAEITKSVSVPTIGIGAGPACDGQVLVCYDLLGMIPSFTPKFVKRYDSLAERIQAATRSFVDEVRAGSFPQATHAFGTSLEGQHLYGTLATQ